MHRHSHSVYELPYQLILRFFPVTIGSVVEATVGATAAVTRRNSITERRVDIFGFILV